jgi:hypothetical protein
VGSVTPQTGVPRPAPHPGGGQPRGGHSSGPPAVTLGPRRADRGLFGRAIVRLFIIQSGEVASERHANDGQTRTAQRMSRTHLRATVGQLLFLE